MSSLDITSGVKLLETRIYTPTSLPHGPVTDDGGQKALKPSILVVSAIECVVSVSDRIATETLCLIKRFLIFFNLTLHVIPQTFRAKILNGFFP